MQRTVGVAGCDDGRPPLKTSSVCRFLCMRRSSKIFTSILILNNAVSLMVFPSSSHLWLSRYSTANGYGCHGGMLMWLIRCMMHVLSIRGWELEIPFFGMARASSKTEKEKKGAKRAVVRLQVAHNQHSFYSRFVLTPSVVIIHLAGTIFFLPPSLNIPISSILS